MDHAKLLALLAFGILSACLITSASVLENATGYGYELIMAKLDYLEYKFLELQVESKAQTEALLQNQNLNQRELANQIREVTEQQKAFVSQENIMNAIFELKPRKHPADNSNLLTFLAIQNSTLHLPTIKSCAEEPSKKSGRYWMTTANNHTFEVYCEQTFYGGGWIVIQNRFNGSVSFYKNWTDYKNGFGSLDGEFWLGLDRVHQLTSTRTRELLVHLEDHDGLVKYARYAKFAIGNEGEKFALKTIESYSGTAGDSLMEYHKGMKFSTPDKDNDNDANRFCGSEYYSGWWFNKCVQSNLNGLYQNVADAKSMIWYHFRSKWYGLKVSKMMIR